MDSSWRRKKKTIGKLEMGFPLKKKALTTTDPNGRIPKLWQFLNTDWKYRLVSTSIAEYKTSK